MVGLIVSPEEHGRKLHLLQPHKSLTALQEPPVLELSSQSSCFKYGHSLSAPTTDAAVQERDRLAKAADPDAPEEAQPSGTFPDLLIECHCLQVAESRVPNQCM